MSNSSKLPGSDRLKRAATPTKRGSEGAAYQGAMEAVGAIVISIGIGWWIDSRYGSSPYGLLGGAVVGFGAFVLKLMRMGQELNPSDHVAAGPEIDDEDLTVGEAPGLSSVLHDDDNTPSS